MQHYVTWWLESWAVSSSDKTMISFKFELFRCQTKGHSYCIEGIQVWSNKCNAMNAQKMRTYSELLLYLLLGLSKFDLKTEKAPAHSSLSKWSNAKIFNLTLIHFLHKTSWYSHDTADEKNERVSLNFFWTTKDVRQLETVLQLQLKATVKRQILTMRKSTNSFTPKNPF